MTRAHELQLVDVARSQAGLLSGADLVRVTGRPDELRRRLRSGLWREVTPGVVVPALTAVTPYLRAAAMCLADPRTVVSHHDAARLLGIWTPGDDRTWVTVPFGSPLRDVPGVRLVRSRRPPQDLREDGLLRWTSPERTIVDLAMCSTPRQLEASLLSAVRVRATTAAAVEREAATMQGRHGLAAVRRVAELWRPERESLLEDQLHAVLVPVVEEVVQRQHVVRDACGDAVARVDMALPELRLAFEADGLFFHSSDAQLAADQARDRQLLALGWLVMRFREDALADPARVRAEIAAVVARRRRDLRAA